MKSNAEYSSVIIADIVIINHAITIKTYDIADMFIRYACEELSAITFHALTGDPTIDAEMQLVYSCLHKDGVYNKLNELYPNSLIFKFYDCTNDNCTEQLYIIAK